MLSSSTATRTKETLSAEFTAVEKVKKKMAREGRTSDAITFSQLYQRLKQHNKIIKKPFVLLSLFKELSEPVHAQPQAYSKFIHGDHLQSTALSGNGSLPNGSGASSHISNISSIPGPLRSIHEIRNELPGSTAATVSSSSGYHPPLPPKPKSPITVLHTNRASPKRDSPPKTTTTVTTSSSNPQGASGDNKELLRELLYTFQVRLTFAI